MITVSVTVSIDPEQVSGIVDLTRVVYMLRDNLVTQARRNMNEPVGFPSGPNGTDYYNPIIGSSIDWAAPRNV